METRASRGGAVDSAEVDGAAPDAGTGAVGRPLAGGGPEGGDAAFLSSSKALAPLSTRKSLSLAAVIRVEKG